MVTIKARFEERFIPEPNSGCWLWTAGIGSGGYGYLWGDGTMLRAHRVAYELYVGPITDGLHVLHRCDVRSCVRPDHLWLGTNADNTADKMAKGRHVAPRGDANGARTHPESRQRGQEHSHAKLTDIQVGEIRAAIGQSQRQLAAIYGVTHGWIGHIRKGLWRREAGSCK